MTVFTMTDQQVIDDTVERLNLTGKVWCFMAGMHPNPHVRSSHGYILGVAVLGEAGWNTTTVFFDDFGKANDRADELNKLLPWNSDTCIAIVADTMSRSRFKAEEESRRPNEREFKVKVSFVHPIDAARNEDDVMDVIRDGLEDNYSKLDIENVEVDLK